MVFQYMLQGPYLHLYGISIHFAFVLRYVQYSAKCTFLFRVSFLSSIQLGYM